MIKSRNNQVLTTLRNFALRRPRKDDQSVVIGAGSESVAWSEFLDHDYTEGDQRLQGRCPICGTDSTYVVHGNWFRDQMVCPNCDGHSIPRERAIARAVEMYYPKWPSLEIHEAAPAARGASAWLRKRCKSYTSSKFDPSRPLGETVEGIQNQNLEQLTLATESVDLLIHLDVMEHVNHPDLVMREAARVLRAGGACIFTTPTYKALQTSQRRATYHDDGSIEHVHPAEYHGSEDEGRAVLVTWDYGYDFPELILRWSGLRTDVIRTCDPRAGIIGEHTEVYICRKM